MKKSKLSVARGAMHDARHAENVLRQNYREAKRKANEFRIEAMALCAEKEAWIFERAKLEKQRDELLAALGVAQATINCAGISTPKIVRDTVEKHAEAIASVKGGA